MLKYYLMILKSDIGANSYIVEHKNIIMIEAASAAVTLGLATVLSRFNFVLLFLTTVTIINFIFLLKSAKKGNFILLKQSPKYQVQEKVGLYFMRINQLTKALIKKGTSKEEISDWEKYFITILKKDKSMIGFTKSCRNIEKIMKTNFACEAEVVTEEMLNKYMSKYFPLDVTKYFPELMSLLATNKISLMTEEASNRTSTKQMRIYGGGETSLQAFSEEMGILGLPITTKSPEIIRQRYLELVKIYHPDKSKADTAEQFRKINEAYEKVTKFLANKPPVA